MIVIDYNPLVIASYFRIDEGWRNINSVSREFFRRVEDIESKFETIYGKAIIVGDCGSSWRKQIYPAYKANRAKDGDETWKEIGTILRELSSIVKSKFPFFEFESLEADDIIGWFARSAKKPMLIISSDRDFLQLQANEHVKQYSTIQGKWVITNNPKEALLEKILRGDTSDNIPSITKELYKLEPDNTQKKTRAKPITKKFIEEFKKGVLYEKYKDRYEENRRLIDLSLTPETLLNEFIQKYKH